MMDTSLSPVFMADVDIPSVAEMAAQAVMTETLLDSVLDGDIGDEIPEDLVEALKVLSVDHEDDLPDLWYPSSVPLPENLKNLWGDVPLDVTGEDIEDISHVEGLNLIRATRTPPMKKWTVKNGDPQMVESTRVREPQEAQVVGKITTTRVTRFNVSKPPEAALGRPADRIVKTIPRPMPKPTQPEIPPKVIPTRFSRGTGTILGGQVTSNPSSVNLDNIVASSSRDPLFSDVFKNLDPSVRAPGEGTKDGSDEELAAFGFLPEGR